MRLRVRVRAHQLGQVVVRPVRRVLGLLDGAQRRGDRRGRGRPRRLRLRRGGLALLLARRAERAVGLAEPRLRGRVRARDLAELQLVPVEPLEPREHCALGGAQPLDRTPRIAVEHEAKLRHGTQVVDIAAQCRRALLVAAEELVPAPAGEVFKPEEDGVLRLIEELVQLDRLVQLVAQHAHLLLGTDHSRVDLHARQPPVVLLVLVDVEHRFHHPLGRVQRPRDSPASTRQCCTALCLDHLPYGALLGADRIRAREVAEHRSADAAEWTLVTFVHGGSAPLG